MESKIEPKRKILIASDDTIAAYRLQQRLDDAEVCIANKRDAVNSAYYSDELNQFDMIVVRWEPPSYWASPQNIANTVRWRKRNYAYSNAYKLEPRLATPLVFTTYPNQEREEERASMQEQERTTTDSIYAPTEKTVDMIAERLGIESTPPEKAAPESDEPTLNVILTYKDVEDYTPHFVDDRLYIMEFDAKSMHQYCKCDINPKYERRWRADEDWRYSDEYMQLSRTPPERIRNVFMYDGKTLCKAPSNIPAAVARDLHLRVNMITCKCDTPKKERFKEDSFVDMYYASRCEAKFELRAIADTILGVRRLCPREETTLPMPLEKILAPAPRL